MHLKNIGTGMTSSRPYLVRALHEWIVDNQLTPYILVNSSVDRVQVPLQYVEANKIILNISPRAVRDLAITVHDIQFEARFDGIGQHIYVPMAAVLAIYTKENGRGMVFDEDEFETTPPPNSENGGKGRKGGTSKSHLTVIK